MVFFLESPILSTTNNDDIAILLATCALWEAVTYKYKKIYYRCFYFKKIKDKRELTIFTYFINEICRCESVVLEIIVD